MILSSRCHTQESETPAVSSLKRKQLRDIREGGGKWGYTMLCHAVLMQVKSIPKPHLPAYKFSRADDGFCRNQKINPKSTFETSPAGRASYYFCSMRIPSSASFLKLRGLIFEPFTAAAAAGSVRVRVVFIELLRIFRLADDMFR